MGTILPPAPPATGREAERMPASLKRIRQAMDVRPTARNKGLKLTIAVVAYDNGIMEVDGVPMGSVESGWTDVAEVLMTTLNEFHTQVRRRRRAGTPRPSDNSAAP
jgi:hypothetical protein